MKVGGVACEWPSSLYLVKICPFIIAGCASVRTHLSASNPTRARSMITLRILLLHVGAHLCGIGEDGATGGPSSTEPL